MKNRIAKRMLSLAPSLTLAISAKAKAMKAAGESVVSFGVGEPDFNTPEHIIDAAKAALDQGHTKYTPSSGLLPLRKAICEKFKRITGFLMSRRKLSFPTAQNILFSTRATRCSKKGMK